jgi:hypothetical protein
LSAPPAPEQLPNNEGQSQIVEQLIQLSTSQPACRHNKYCNQLLIKSTLTLIVLQLFLQAINEGQSRIFGQLFEAIGTRGWCVAAVECDQLANNATLTLIYG